MSYNITLTPAAAEALDVAHWKPVTPVAAVELLGTLACTADSPDSLAAQVTGFDDGRVRILHHALVKQQGDPSEAQVQAYLMHIYCPETGKSVWFERQNVTLALD